MQQLHICWKNKNYKKQNNVINWCKQTEQFACISGSKLMSTYTIANKIATASVIFCLLLYVADGIVTAHEPLYILVSAPPRMGTTWLFNAVRILVRYHDPNVISGFATSFSSRDLCYWRARNVSMVVKTHALMFGWMLGANCPYHNTSNSILLHSNVSSTKFVPGFDLAVSSFRDPFDTACSLIRKDGYVSKNMYVNAFIIIITIILISHGCIVSAFWVVIILWHRCEKVLCEQHAFAHPPEVKEQPLRPKIVFEMDYKDLWIANTEHSLQSNNSKTKLLLQSLANALGLSHEFSDNKIAFVAEELAKLRPLGDPKHSLQMAQVLLLKIIMRCTLLWTWV